MPADKEIITEQDQDDALLENMESTLQDMRGDDSYDDVDNMADDAVDTLDQRQDDTNDEQTQAPGEETPGEPKQTEAGAGSPDDTASADTQTGSDGDDRTTPLTPDEQDAEDDKMMESFSNERTTERFQQFRDDNKQLGSDLGELQAQHEELRTASSTLFDYLDESHTHPEQLSAELAINKAVNTGDFSQVRPAYERMQRIMATVATGLGDASSPAPLSPELQTSVDNLDITPELAQNMATQQATQELQNQYRQLEIQRQQQASQQTQQEQAAVQDKHTAAAAIKVWETDLASTDPDFTGKQQQMLQGAQQIMSSRPPTEWLGALQQEYQTITATQKRMMDAQNLSRAKNNQVLRPGAGSGSGHAQKADSFESNFNATLKGMRPLAE